MVHLQRAVEMSRFGIDNHITAIITIYREWYSIKRNLGIVVFFFFFWHLFILTSSFVSIFVCFREIIAGFDTDESYNYTQFVI